MMVEEVRVTVTFLQLVTVFIERAIWLNTCSDSMREQSRDNIYDVIQRAKYEAQRSKNLF